MFYLPWMIHDISVMLVKKLNSIKNEESGFSNARTILQSFWSDINQKLGYSYVQSILPECIQEDGFFIIHELKKNGELLPALKHSILEVFTDEPITYALLELEALIHFNRCEFKVANNYFQIIPFNFLHHYRESLLSLVLTSEDHHLTSTQYIQDVADYLDERLRMNVELDTSNIEDEKIKVYYKNTLFNFGKYKGEQVGSLDVPLEYLLWCVLNVPFFTIEYSFLNYIVRKNPSLPNSLAIEVAIYKNELVQINEEAKYEEGIEDASDAYWGEELSNEEIDLISGGEIDVDDFGWDWDRLYAERGLD